MGVSSKDTIVDRVTFPGLAEVLHVPGKDNKVEVLLIHFTNATTKLPEVQTSTRKEEEQR